MNERIKQLMEQAKYEEAVFGGGFGGPNMVKKLDPIKFAELIVKECLSIVEPTEDSGDEWCVTLKGAAQEIKEHFGVEE